MLTYWRGGALADLAGHNLEGEAGHWPIPPKCRATAGMAEFCRSMLPPIRLHLLPVPLVQRPRKSDLIEYCHLRGGSSARRMTMQVYLNFSVLVVRPPISDGSQEATLCSQLGLTAGTYFAVSTAQLSPRRQPTQPPKCESSDSYNATAASISMFQRAAGTMGDGEPSALLNDSVRS